MRIRLHHSLRQDSEVVQPKALTSVEVLGIKLGKKEQGCVGEVPPNGSILSARPRRLCPDKKTTLSTRTKRTVVTVWQPVLPAAPFLSAAPRESCLAR